MPQPIVTLLTDFGSEDYYVAAVKGTILRLAPGTILIDVSHDVEPGDVEAAAFLLGASHPHFPGAAIHVAVVDPGVGGERAILAARTENAYFVAPDNGLLGFLPERTEFRQVERPGLFLDGPGATFHGRDRFAPVAAYLARGEPFDDLGCPLVEPVRLEREPPRRDADGLRGTIVHVDRFGNLISDIPSSWFPESETAAFECRLGRLDIRRRASHYAELAPGETALIPGSLGTLEVSRNGESAANHGGVGRGEALTVVFR